MSFIGGGTTIFESFETQTPGSSRNPVTSVGSFTGLGTAGSGSTAVSCGGAAVGDGACVKPAGSAGGRFATDGQNWLDSNDMESILWTIPGPDGAPFAAITRIAFLLTDIDDVDWVRFNIQAGGDAIGSTQNSVSGGLRDGRLHLVTMDFSEAVRNVAITMTNGRNDGFGIDSVGVAVAPVPLPAAGWLMIAGLGGLAALRRRRKV
ncbi:MAG: VPLPA-CTERM sorting domain-containing protein [Rhodobacteraceae bacterium]|nr:MAG: VPLPA-CTERM sorting domain-containing protein [Paracoccaceae bacterium]